MARTYHWSPRYIESELTDELLVLYLDEEADAVRDRVQAEFNRLVEGVRAGTIFSHKSGAAAYRKWASRQTRKQKPMSDAALVHAIMNVARIFPDNVEHVTA